VENTGGEPLQILGGWLPHSRFRCETINIPVLNNLAYREKALLEFSVVCAEAPGTVVENAFLILRVFYCGKFWRIFIRLRVRFDDQGAPETTVELMTAHLIGFSQEGGKPCQ
jgi:hypothetical protein